MSNPVFCGNCGGKIRWMFNLQPSCPRFQGGCKPAAPPPPWPFWSRFADGPPVFLERDSQMDASSRYTVGDVVVAWKAPVTAGEKAAAAQSKWVGSGGWGFFPQIPPVVHPGPEDVFCLKNSTWDRAVNKYFKGLCEAHRDLLKWGQEPAPEWMTKRFGYDRMAILMRPTS